MCFFISLYQRKIAKLNEIGHSVKLHLNTLSQHKKGYALSSDQHIAMSPTAHVPWKTFFLETVMWCEILTRTSYSIAFHRVSISICFPRKINTIFVVFYWLNTCINETLEPWNQTPEWLSSWSVKCLILCKNTGNTRPKPGSTVIKVFVN